MSFEEFRGKSYFVDFADQGAVSLLSKRFERLMEK